MFDPAAPITEYPRPGLEASAWLSAQLEAADLFAGSLVPEEQRLRVGLDERIVIPVEARGRTAAWLTASAAVEYAACPASRLEPPRVPLAAYVPLPATTTSEEMRDVLVEGMRAEGARVATLVAAVLTPGGPEVAAAPGLWAGRYGGVLVKEWITEDGTWHVRCRTDVCVAMFAGEHARV